MTPDQIKEARTQLGMSFRQFANALDLQGRDAARTVRRYESGDLLPSQVTEGRIRHLLNEMEVQNV